MEEKEADALEVAAQENEEGEEKEKPRKEINMDRQLVCSSCKCRITNVEGSVIFKCPSCGKSDVVRCKHCRQIAAKYKCHECGFAGPN